MAIPNELVTEALKLPAEDRAELVERLLDSLEDDEAIDPGHEAAWTDVIARRVREIREGRASLIDRGAAIARVRAAVAAVDARRR